MARSSRARVSAAPHPPTWNQIGSAALAAVICFALAAVGSAIAITGPELTSNVPYLPPKLNQLVGRVFIGLGAVATAAVGIYALLDAARLLRARRSGAGPLQRPPGGP